MGYWMGLLGVSSQNSHRGGGGRAGGVYGREGAKQGGGGMNERTKLYTFVKIRVVEFGNMTFQPKIFRLKMVKFQIFVEIGRWPESTKDNLPPIFWTFLVVPKNVHFTLCTWKF
jgi:hypothetical protein